MPLGPAGTLAYVSEPADFRAGRVGRRCSSAGSEAASGRKSSSLRALMARSSLPTARPAVTFSTRAPPVVR